MRGATPSYFNKPGRQSWENPWPYAQRCSAKSMRPQTWFLENAVPRLKANAMKRQKIFSLALLLIEVAFTLFLAGIVVPSLLRSELATKEALAQGSLHAINIAGFAFSYTTQSVGFAILGSLAGALVAFVIHFRAAAPRKTTSSRRTILRAALLRH
jgi:hypothetical protein